MKVSVTTSGLERLRAKINRRVNFLGKDGIQKVLEDSGAELLRMYKRKVDSFTPGEVPDLKDATKRQKMREVGFIYPILRRTGELLDSMAVKVVPPQNGKGWLIRVSFRGVHEGGTRNQVIADAHLNGGGRNPVRDFTKVSPQWVGNLLKQVRAGFTRR